MRALWKNLGIASVMGCVGIMSLTACNTTKATVDTVVKFTSSTSPDSMFNQDGIVADNRKVDLYAAVVYDNLQQDIAKGHGEYLASLGVLLDVPQDRQADWNQFAQSKYANLFADQAMPNEGIVGKLRELAPGPVEAAR
jgi:hypothetical protein